MLALLTLVSSLGQAFASENGIPVREQGFHREQLTRTSSLQLANPAGFGMQQSYSFQYTASSLGSRSSGVYLNTISYQFGIPLTLSVDIGLYNLLHTSGQMNQGLGFQQFHSDPSDPKPEFLLPRIGLDYRPTSNVLLSLQVMNVPDAYRAYGPYPFFRSPYDRW